MDLNNSFSGNFVGAVAALVGAFCVVFQIYQMTVIDATAQRILKHPKFWGVFAMSGNNSSGLLMYLIGRRKYPIVNMSESNSKELEKRKKSRDWIVIFGYWCNWYYMCNLNITKKYRFMIIFCNIYKAVSLRIDCFTPRKE